MKRFKFIRLTAAGLVLISSALSAAPPDNAEDTIIEGEFMIVHIDYKKRNSEYAYHIRDKDTGEIVKLKFERKPPEGLHTGDNVTIHGKKQDKQLWVQDIGSTQSSSEDMTQTLETVAGAATQRKAIYMVVNFANSSNPAYFTDTSVTSAANRMFYDRKRASWRSSGRRSRGVRRTSRAGGRRAGSTSPPRR